MFLVGGSMYPRLERFAWASTQRAVPNWPFLEESLDWYKPGWLKIEPRQLPHYSN
jgi:hypothetical protein